jgi:hypothetical protein
MIELLTKERFNKELFSLNGEGDPEAVYKYLVSQFIEKTIKTFDGTPITFDLIVQKYKEYLSWWNVKFGDSDPKYVAKVDKIKSIDVFLIKSMYNQSFTIPRKKRDFYLKGNHTLKYLRERLKVFNSKVTNNNLYDRKEEIITEEEDNNKPF